MFVKPSPESLYVGLEYFAVRQIWYPCRWLLLEKRVCYMYMYCL